MSDSVKVDQSTPVAPTTAVVGANIVTPVQVSGEEVRISEQILLQLRRIARLLEILVDEQVGIEDLEDEEI